MGRANFQVTTLTLDAVLNVYSDLYRLEKTKIFLFQFQYKRYTERDATSSPLCEG